MFITNVRAARWQLLQAFLDSVAWIAAVSIAVSQFTVNTEAGTLASLVVLASMAIVLQLSVGVCFHLYQGRYRFGSFDEAVGLAKAVLTTGLLLVALTLVLAATHVIHIAAVGVSAGATLLAAAAMFGGRLFRRVLMERARRHGLRSAPRVLVFGAGIGGAQAISAMLSDDKHRLFPVAALDDDPTKRMLHIMGVPVVGGRTEMATAVHKYRATMLVVAVPSAEAKLVRMLNEMAHGLGLRVMVVPSVGDLVDGRVHVRDIREIRLEDLLGRRAIETDLAVVARYLEGKRVLVTGAGGSIGSELCREITRYGPARLVMLDRDESALHAVHLDITGLGLLDSDDLVLADIRDADRLVEVFEYHRPEVVFHAAALKHLPLLERHPHEAIKTNVWGTISVLDAATRTGVKHFVNISTDKAADPSSVLGSSKRLAERVTAQVAEETQRPYVSVRFGNVLGSRGSVISTFRAQAASGGPLTVTHPEVTRFFMTVREAVQLVIHAAAIATGGEVLVLDMGEPVRIADIARRVADMIDPDIGISYTGLRSGEKLHEALFGVAEDEVVTSHPLISAVDVPPLMPSQALAFDMDASPSKLMDEMQALCVAAGWPGQDLADLDHVIDLTRASQWSGPERRLGERKRLPESLQITDEKQPESRSSNA